MVCRLHGNSGSAELQTRLADTMDTGYTTGCYHGRLPCLLEFGNEPMQGPWAPATCHTPEQLRRLAVPKRDLAQEYDYRGP